jgi:hypothetical protein
MSLGGNPDPDVPPSRAAQVDDSQTPHRASPVPGDSGKDDAAQGVQTESLVTSIQGERS